MILCVDRDQGVLGMSGQLGFFDLEDRYAQLSKAGDPLEKLASVVDFEPFR